MSAGGEGGGRERAEDFLRFMKSLYSNLKSCIKASKDLTDYFHCTLGTRHGCKCNPIFFFLYLLMTKCHI